MSLADPAWKRKREIDDAGLVLAFGDVGGAVKQFHSKFIAHRDIKPANLCHPLNSHTWAMKLIDFDAAHLDAFFWGWKISICFEVLL